MKQGVLTIITIVSITLMLLSLLENPQPAEAPNRPPETAIRSAQPVQPPEKLPEPGTPPNPAPESTLPGETAESMAKWRDYKNGKIPFESLSEANQKRGNQSKYIEWKLQDEARRKKLQAMDIAEGRNAGVRARENELRQQAEKFHQGMELTQIEASLGTPSRTHSPAEFFPPQRFEKAGTVLIYSPHPTGRISPSMGDSFQYLEVWINTNNQTLSGWRWKTPGMVSYNN
jgi:hypothetical protein